MGHSKGHSSGRRLISIFLCLVASFTIIASSTQSASALSDYLRTIFKQNNILFWNPDEKTSYGCTYGDIASDVEDTVIQGNDNASTAVGFLMQNGYTKTAAVAIVGNLMVESGVNPRKLQGGAIVESDFVAYKDGSKTFSGGFGLAQWTSGGRVKNLQAYADSKNLNVATLSAQLGFLLQELTGSYKSSVAPNVLNNLGLDDAVFRVRRYYEGPARMVYDTHNGTYYNDYVPNTLSEVSESRTPGAYYELTKAFNAAQSILGITPTSPVLSEDKSVVCNHKPIDTNTLVFYNQCDSAWGKLNYGKAGINGNNNIGTICSSGCGPTSFAVIATNLLHQSITPAETADIAGIGGMHVQGVGSSHQITRFLGDHYNLNVVQIEGTIEKINEYLDKGYMIHTSGKGSMPFTRGGHYIAIVSHLENGNWLVADSSSRGPSGEYTPNDVISAGMQKGNVWAVGVK